MSETAILFVLCYATGLLLAFVRGPVWGLYLYLAIVYLHPPSRWWSVALPDVRWSFLAAIVTFLALFLHRDKLANRPPWYGSVIAKCLIAYTAWMWIQAIWVPSPWHLEGPILFTKYLILFYLVHEIVDSRERIRAFLFVNVLGAAYFGILIILAPDSGRLEGVGGPGLDNANSLGMHLSAVLMFASFLLLAERGWRRWVVVFSIPLILNGIIQTESRGALVGLLAGGLLTLYLKPKRIRKAYYGLAAVALIGIGGMLNQSFVGRVGEAVSAAAGDADWDQSASSRVELVKAQLRMFKDYPLGAGHQGTTALSPRYLDERFMAKTTGNRASHNTVMSVLVDQGIVGITIFTIMFVATIKAIRRLKRADNLGLDLELGLFRAGIVAALGVVFGAGMFADYLKAEVQIWSLILICTMIELSAGSQLSSRHSGIRGAQAGTR